MSVEQALLSFALVAGLLTLVPGMDTALVLRSAVSQGRGKAYATALGINTGALVWGIAAAVGASALLAASETAFTVLKIAGAVYMVWLGGRMLWKSFRRRAMLMPGAAEPDASASYAKAWLTGVGTNLLNPKVGVFYMAMIPQFIPPDVSPALMGTALAMVHNLEGLVFFSAIIWGTHVARQWLRTPAVVRAIDRVTGTVLVGFGLALAAEAR
ncbi:LysE family transporter [Arthrobacter sp.]|uniref:LysE family translocator n=1 Tax=Arthrobacter sp. TaxID=1667 RepID=UPI0033913DFC